MNPWNASAGPSKNRALLQRGHSSCSQWVLQKECQSRVQERVGRKGSAPKMHWSCHNIAAKSSFKFPVSEIFCVGYFKETKGNLLILWAEKTQKNPKRTKKPKTQNKTKRQNPCDCGRLSLVESLNTGLQEKHCTNSILWFPFPWNMGRVDLCQMHKHKYTLRFFFTNSRKHTAQINPYHSIYSKDKHANSSTF